MRVGNRPKQGNSLHRNLPQCYQRSKCRWRRLRKGLILFKFLEINSNALKYKLLLSKQYRHVNRRRKTIQELYDDAGCRAERKFRMDRVKFEQLHNIVGSKIEETFTISTNGNPPSNKIDSSI